MPREVSVSTDSLREAFSFYNIDMSFEGPLPKKELTPNEASVQIEAIKAQIRVLGGNDTEPSEIEEIRKGLESGELKPLEAVELAQAILDRKQDYH